MILKKYILKHVTSSRFKNNIFLCFFIKFRFISRLKKCSDVTKCKIFHIDELHSCELVKELTQVDSLKDKKITDYNSAPIAKNYMNEKHSNDNPLMDQLMKVYELTYEEKDKKDNASRS